MIRHYLVTAIRNLNKYKFYTSINILGLSVGITACMVIVLYVRDELNYDRYNANADRIYRIDRELKYGLNQDLYAATHAPMAAAMLTEFPEVEDAARFYYDGSHKFKREIENIVEWRMVYTDNSLFNIFTIPFLEGNSATALTEPNSMVISEEFAQRMFPDESALNKLLIMDEKTVLKITGVYKEIPEASHFHFRIFLSMEGLKESKSDSWIASSFITYVMLHKQADPEALGSKLHLLVEKYVAPQVSQLLGGDFMEKFTREGNFVRYSMRPLLDIHLHSQIKNELEANGDIVYVYLLSVIAVFILFIAAINFMNLTTARSITRSKEVGVRKVVGANRAQLIRQFLAESIILCIISFAVAIWLTSLVLPLFNNLAGRHLTIPWNYDYLVFAIIPLAILIGILAGIYPAFILSAFKPLQVLKGKPIFGSASTYVKMGLVVFQFCVSIFLIITTIAIYLQLNFIQNKKLGFNKDQVLVIRDVFDIGDDLYSLKSEIEKNSYVKSGTITAFFPGPNSARSSPLMWPSESSIISNGMPTERWIVDYDYIPTLGMVIKSGRNFSRDFPSDSTAVILNESAIRNMGFEGDPIGQEILVLRENMTTSTSANNTYDKRTIIGVVGDFNFNSFHEDIAPLGLFFGKSVSFLSFRLEGNDIPNAIANIEQTWKKMLPGQPFNYSFLDDTFAKMFDFERRLGKLFGLFAGLAIIIACLGLFALTAFIAEQRTKEIGIRKVMGASSINILILLSSEFSKLILVAYIIAIPIAAYAIHLWLQQYVYKANIGIMVYLIAGIIALVLGVLTMGFQSLKAAKMNPVKSLRSE